MNHAKLHAVWATWQRVRKLEKHCSALRKNIKNELATWITMKIRTQTVCWKYPLETDRGKKSQLMELLGRTSLSIQRGILLIFEFWTPSEAQVYFAIRMRKILYYSTISSPRTCRWSITYSYLVASDIKLYFLSLSILHLTTMLNCVHLSQWRKNSRDSSKSGDCQ